jgi:uncharacterized integral membrane protein
LAGFLAILLLVVFVLSNRVPVLLGMWPFGTATVWLGPVMVGALAVGVLLGLLAHLPTHISLRRRARNAEKRVAQLTSPQDSAKPPA